MNMQEGKKFNLLSWSGVDSMYKVEFVLNQLSIECLKQK